MAKCEKREIEPEPPPVEYVLTLSEDEALMLRAALRDTRGAEGVYAAVRDATLDVTVTVQTRYTTTGGLTVQRVER